MEYEYSKKKFDGSLYHGKIKSDEEFELSHGDEIVFFLPKGTTVTITEDDYANDGYITSYKKDKETSVAGRSKQIKNIDKKTTLAFTNTRDGAIPTGVWMPLGTMILLAIIFLAGGLFSMWRARRYYSGMES